MLFCKYSLQEGLLEVRSCKEAVYWYSMKQTAKKEKESALNRLRIILILHQLSKF